MTHAIRATSKVEPDGRVLLPPLPQAAGKTVDVIILVDDEATPAGTQPVLDHADASRYPLRTRPYEFKDPFSPVTSPQEWEPPK